MSETGQEIVDLMEAYRTEVEAIFYSPDQLVIGIAKVGGGTIGKSYHGEQWIVNVYQHGELKASEKIVASGNHLEVVVKYAEQRFLEI